MARSANGSHLQTEEITRVSASIGFSVRRGWNVSSWHLATLLPFSSLPLPIKADILLDAAQLRSNVMGRPRSSRGRALSSGQATARPSPQAVSAHSGHDRSAKNTGGIHYARFHNANNQDWSRCPACMLHRGSRINLYPVERQRLVPKSCILVAARLQDGWNSSLVRLIRPTRHPQSHIRPGIGPEAWAKLIQLIK